MRITIQQGIDARPLAAAIAATIRAGMECDALAARKRHEERMSLIKRGAGAAVVVESAEERGRVLG